MAVEHVYIEKEKYERLLKNLASLEKQLSDQIKSKPDKKVTQDSRVNTHSQEVSQSNTSPEEQVLTRAPHPPDVVQASGDRKKNTGRKPADNPARKKLLSKKEITRRIAPPGVPAVGLGARIPEARKNSKLPGKARPGTKKRPRLSHQWLTL